jgi:hypothetical protein
MEDFLAKLTIEEEGGGGSAPISSFSWRISSSGKSGECTWRSSRDRFSKYYTLFISLRRDLPCAPILQ